LGKELGVIEQGRIRQVDGVVTLDFRSVQVVIRIDGHVLEP